MSEPFDVEAVRKRLQRWEELSADMDRDEILTLRTQVRTDLAAACDEVERLRVDHDELRETSRNLLDRLDSCGCYPYVDHGVGLPKQIIQQEAGKAWNEMRVLLARSDESGKGG